MSERLDWAVAAPMLAAAAAFGLVYAVSVAGGAPTEVVLLRGAGILFIVGCAGVLLRNILTAALPPAAPASGRLLDVTLDEEMPELDATPTEEAA